MMDVAWGRVVEVVVMFLWKEKVSNWQINISQPQGHKKRISPSADLFTISTTGFYLLGTNK